MTDEPASPSHNIPTQPAPRPVQPSSAWLVVQRGPQVGEEIRLQPGSNLFGREEGHLLRDQRVSRLHAQIQDNGRDYLLVDLNSTNGSFVNGQRIIHSTPLQHGDTIRLGDTILMLRIEGEGQYDPNIMGARTAELPPERLHDTTLLPGAPQPLNKSTDLPPQPPKPSEDLPGAQPKPAPE